MAAVSFRAGGLDGLVDFLLKLVGRKVSESLSRGADGLVKKAPADGFLDEFG